MNTMIENYTNGNISTAKNIAKKYSINKIITFLENAGYNSKTAINIASYLKGFLDFQTHCNN